MRHPDEIEEMNFCPQSDLQTALAVSEMEAAQRESEQQGKLAALILAGKFVVTGRVQMFCPRTDAGLRTAGLCILKVADSRWEADNEARFMQTIEGSCDDVFDLRVLPQKV